MDYNLFLRAAQGIFPERNSQAHGNDLLPLNRAALRTFAQFLAERWLIWRFRWWEDGLALGLVPIKSSFFQSLMDSFGSFTKHNSYILLRGDGSVEAHCSETNLKDLSAMRAEPISKLQLEELVVAAVSTAWDNFREGDLKAAERTLGQIPDVEIFVKPPSRLGALRFIRIMLLVCLALILVSQFFQERFDGLKPVSTTEAQVRAFLGSIKTNSNNNIISTGSPWIAMDFCLVLPPANLFSQDGLLATRQEVLRFGGFNTGGTLDSKYTSLGNSWTFGKAIAGGWFSLNDLGVDSGKMSAALHNPKLDTWMKLRFQLSQFSCSSDGAKYTVEQINSMILGQLRLLRDVNCLNLVGRERIVQQLCSLQVLSGAASAGRPPLRNWRDVRGLFYTPGWPVLQDTYCDLAALEILGGLDKIDREGCIKMILKLHRGTGYFKPSDMDEKRRLNIKGDARDTIAAFESLRILGALDRVKDLDKWQFRVDSDAVTKLDANGVRVLTWDEIEAWVCQQRLEKILREHKANPSAHYRSLLEP